MRYFQAMSLVAVLLLATSVSCSKQGTDSAADPAAATDTAVTLVNTACPIQGGKANQKVTVEWNGNTVGFCCADCIPAWNELSDEEKTAQLASAESKGPSDHGSGKKAEPASQDDT